MKQYKKNNITNKHSVLQVQEWENLHCLSPTDFILTTLGDTSIMCWEIKLSSKTPDKGKYLHADSRTSALDNT